MAEFDPAFEKVLDIEGGYKLHTIPGDRGGMTYAGIARNRWPTWPGWARVDAGQFDDGLKLLVRAFFKQEFWDRIMGDDIGSQAVAYHLYAFSVNTGRRAAVKIAQRIIGAKVDGMFGPATFRALNLYVQEVGERVFVLEYSLAKVFRFTAIVLADKRRKQDHVVSNLKFLPGWNRRVQRGLEL